jgi:hypothetical protein
MLLYTDVLTNDQLASDAYDPKLIDDIVFEIDCAQIVIKEGEVNTGELGLKFGHKRGTMARGLAVHSDAACASERHTDSVSCFCLAIQVPMLPLKRLPRLSRRVPKPLSTP